MKNHWPINLQQFVTNNGWNLPLNDFLLFAEFNTDFSMPLVSPLLGAIVMTDNISCLTHFPKGKTQSKVDTLNIYCETFCHNKELFTFTNLQHSPKSSHLHNLNKKSVSDFHICKNKLKQTKSL